jgi:hypothetical protein
METINGRIKKVMGRSKIKAVGVGCNSPNHHNRRILWGLILVSTLSIAGCSLGKIKSGLMTGAATSAAVGVTSVLAPGVLVPAAVGGTTAAVASALTAESSIKGDPVEVQAETFVQEAPDNFWTLLGKLTKVGGWALILIVLVPMVFSWLMPGPIQFKGKKKK